MAKITITLEDRDDGTVAAAVDFGPSLKRDADGGLFDNLTRAQTDAFHMIDAVFSYVDLVGIE